MISRYRAWMKSLKWMCDVTNISFDSKFVDICQQGDIERYTEMSVEFDEIELMQSTGLEDDFGKEIFEGDVILWTYWDEFEDSGRAKIVFDKGMFKLLDIHTEKEIWDSLFDCIENCNVYLQGNVYENPEILEEKE
nr:MAG TPA: YopX protein [Caudoviricetes sp.]